MTLISKTVGGVRVLECATKGPALQNDRDAVELITAAWENRASWVVIPVERLAKDFFQLRTRIAGEILQKFVTYQLRVAIVGDISHYVSESDSFRDFVYESNRGNQIWFVRNHGELEQQLGSQNTSTIM
jgi:hypothetical protein